MQVLTSLITIRLLHWYFGRTDAPKSLCAAVCLVSTVMFAVIIRGKNPVYEALHDTAIPRLRRHWRDGNLTARLRGSPFGVWLAVSAAAGAMGSRDEAFFLEQCSHVIRACHPPIKTCEELVVVLADHLWIPSRMNQLAQVVWEACSAKAPVTETLV
jgi:hypothetical protein